MRIYPGHILNTMEDFHLSFHLGSNIKVGEVNLSYGFSKFRESETSVILDQQLCAEEFLLPVEPKFANQFSN